MKLSGNKCQCGACKAYFKSVHAFDKHRVGAASDRRCLDDIQMVKCGMVKRQDGFWISAAWDRQINDNENLSSNNQQ